MAGLDSIRTNLKNIYDEAKMLAATAISLNEAFEAEAIPAKPTGSGTPSQITSYQYHGRFGTDKRSGKYSEVRTDQSRCGYLIDWQRYQTPYRSTNR